MKKPQSSHHYITLHQS